MRIDIITVLPEMLEGFFNCSIMSRAQKKGIAEIHIHNLRDYAYDRYRKVDDYPFGGFAGMVMKIERRGLSAAAERDLQSDLSAARRRPARSARCAERVAHFGRAFKRRSFRRRLAGRERDRMRGHGGLRRCAGGL